MIRSVFDVLIAWATGWWGLFGLCATAGLITPVPEDLVLVWAGMQVELGVLALAPALVITTSGVFVRDLIAYWLGRLLGDWLLGNRWVHRLLGKKRLARAIRLVEQHGTAAIVIGRCLVGMRTPVFLVAGASGVGFRRFAIVDGVGVLITVPLVLAVGYFVGAPAIDALFWVSRSARAIFWVAAGVGAVWLIWMWRRRARNARLDEEDWGEDPEAAAIAEAGSA